MNNLNFTGTGSYLNIDQRAMAEILRTTQVRWGFEISDGCRPADPIIAHKATPTIRVIKDQSLMRRPIAIPIGSVISALPIMSKSFYQTSAYYDASMLSGMYAPVPVSGDTGLGTGSAVGNVNNGLGHDATNILNSPVEDSIEGYGKLNLAAILANGGTAANDPYHLYDYAGAGYEDEPARVDVMGQIVTSASRFYRPANIPIGVVTEDIYIDDQGRYLNFTTNTLQKFRSFMTDWYVEVPYVIQSYNAALGTPSGADWSAGGKAAYNALIALGMPLMFVNTMANLIGGLGRFVKPEINGKYQLDASTDNKTIQHVGRLTSIDNKFPKDLSELIMVVKDTGVGGTDTYGLPYRLFLLANTILKNTGVPTPTFSQIMGLVTSGYVGVARINLHVS